MYVDQRRCQNAAVRTSVTHLAITFCATFLFLLKMDVICDQSLTRYMTRWNLFAIIISIQYILSWRFVTSPQHLGIFGNKLLEDYIILHVHVYIDYILNMQRL